MRAASPTADRLARISEVDTPELPHAQLIRTRLPADTKRPLEVMKFGGTSVGDASCIARVAEIVWAASQKTDIVVVVAAMCGVTNKLIEAAIEAAGENLGQCVNIFDELRERHLTTVHASIRLNRGRQQLGGRMEELLQEGIRCCELVLTQRELTPRLADAISGLGERLSAPLIAAALSERGFPSEAVEATELIVTNSCHEAADPDMSRTQERCESRLRPLVVRGLVPVITGFIGASADGILTTLGRNSSDHSGTIIAAALNADQVVIWTDVDGVLTADPKVTRDARPIREMSFAEACRLADSGAKVVHPKALRTASQYALPVYVRNTFAPNRPGTRIGFGETSIAAPAGR